MFFALTDDQRALSEAVQEFLADQFPVGTVRAVCYDGGDADPDQLWKAEGEQGWLAVTVPEEHDGLGLGLLDAAVVARRFGAGIAPGPWRATVIAAEAIRLAGSPEQQGHWLPRVASGDAELTFAFRGPSAAWDTSGIGVTADGDTLTGRLSLVEFADSADAFVVAARDGDGVALFLVDRADADVTPVETLDRSTRLCEVTLGGIRGERLAGGSRDVFEDALDRAAVLVANDLVGLAREALTRTVCYDIERTQFGRPVGSFQALKHQLADLLVGVTMAEHGALYAAHAIDEQLPDKRLAVSIAKAKSSDVARDVTAAMIQLHGGIGFTWEHDTHLFFKRAKREEYEYGDATFHRERIARLVVDMQS